MGGGGGVGRWGGRFRGETDARVVEFTRSIDVDAALAGDDIEGSIAHVRGLGRAGILTAAEVEALVDGLRTLAAEGDAGEIAWDPPLQDVHMNLEAALEARIGPLARKLHTGRSRNDQVATDLRLWARRAIDRLDAGLVGMERALVGLAEREGEAILPGTTHIQPAQPVLLAHHLLAYVEMLERDRGRFADARRRLNVSPLGSGAPAGAGHPLGRGARATRPGVGGEGISAPSPRCSGSSRACRSHTSGTFRRTSRRCSTPSACSNRRSASWPGSWRRWPWTPAGCGPRPTRASRLPRPSPMPSSGAASPSGARTMSSARSWLRRRCAA